MIGKDADEINNKLRQNSFQIRRIRHTKLRPDLAEYICLCQLTIISPSDTAAVSLIL